MHTGAELSSIQVWVSVPGDSFRSLSHTFLCGGDLGGMFDSQMSEHCCSGALLTFPQIISAEQTLHRVWVDCFKKAPYYTSFTSHVYRYLRFIDTQHQSLCSHSALLSLLGVWRFPHAAFTCLVMVYINNSLLLSFLAFAATWRHIRLTVNRPAVTRTNCNFRFLHISLRTQLQSTEYLDILQNI